jgi:hypothetical protein
MCDESKFDKQKLTLVKVRKQLRSCISDEIIYSKFQKFSGSGSSPVS